MSIELEYKHREHAPEWTKIVWPYDLPPILAARELAENLADDWADEEDELDKGSIYDDIEIRYNGKELEF